MTPLLIAHIIVSLLLTVTILLQAKGTGLGSAWGGSGEHYRTRRGAERLLFTSTVVLSLLFIILSIINAVT